MRQIGGQILLVAVVLIGLASCLEFSLAQERDSWNAESITMSPDGRYLAVKYNAGKRDGDDYISEVWIYNLDDLSSTPRHLADINQYYSRLAISPGSHLIAIAEKRRLRVFNIIDHSLVFDFPYTWPERSILHHRLSYSPDSRHLMYYRNVQHYRRDSGADEGRIIVWDIATGLRDLEIAYRNPDIAGNPWLSPDCASASG